MGEDQPSHPLSLDGETTTCEEQASQQDRRGRGWNESQASSGDSDGTKSDQDVESNASARTTIGDEL